MSLSPLRRHGWLLASVALAASPLARAIEITAEGITAPVFDAAGHKTHELKARRGTGSPTQKHLEGVEVRYFALDDATRVVQRVLTDEATWDQTKGTLTGNGAVTVENPLSTLSGRGFDFALATSVLNVQREFKLIMPEFVLTSDRAIAELAVERSGDRMKIRDLKRCEATDNLRIVVLPAGKKSFEFAEATSTHAIYDGSTRIVTFPNPLRGRAKDSKVDVETEFEKTEVKLGPPPPRAAPAVSGR